MTRVQLIWVFRNRAPFQAGVKNHEHNYYQVFHVLNGELVITVGSDKFRVCKGEGVLVPKGCIHNYVNEKHELAEFYEIKFAITSTSLDAAVMRLEPMVLKDELYGLLYSRIVSEYSTLGHLADDSATAYLTAVIYALTAGQQLERCDEFSVVDVSEYAELSQKIIAYLEENYSRDVSLDELALVVGRNKNYLCGAFKKDTQTSIGDCKNIIRIRKAAELITYSDLSLATVASMCGFSTVNHFSRVFKKYTGIPPGQCRRAYPADILLQDAFRKPNTNLPNPFIYSVLARKSIDLDSIREFEKMNVENEKGDN